MKKIFLVLLVTITTISCSDESIDEDIQKKSFLEKFGGTMWVTENGYGYEFTLDQDAPIIYWEGCDFPTLTPTGKMWIIDENSLTERFKYNDIIYKRIYTIKNDNLVRTVMENDSFVSESKYPKASLGTICN